MARYEPEITANVESGAILGKIEPVLDRLLGFHELGAKICSMIIK